MKIHFNDTKNKPQTHKQIVEDLQLQLEATQLALESVKEQLKPLREQMDILQRQKLMVAYEIERFSKMRAG